MIPNTFGDLTIRQFGVGLMFYSYTNLTGVLRYGDVHNWDERYSRGNKGWFIQWQNGNCSLVDIDDDMYESILNLKLVHKDGKVLLGPGYKIGTPDGHNWMIEHDKI